MEDRRQEKGIGGRGEEDRRQGEGNRRQVEGNRRQGGDSEGVEAPTRPGNITGDPKVVDIQCLRYLPDAFIIYKLKHGDYE